MGDGEDYELCFTASGEVPAQLGSLTVTQVGVVKEYPGGNAPRIVVRDGDVEYDGSAMGWEHKA